MLAFVGGGSYGAAMSDAALTPETRRLPAADDAARMFDLPRPAADCRIVVAMSGGVDSSVVAALAHGVPMVALVWPLAAAR